MSNIHIRPGSKFGDTAGGNYAEFEADGTLVFYGNAMVFDDLRVEPTVRSSGVNVPAFAQWFTNGAGSRGVYLYNFTNEVVANEKEVYFTAQMPHSWAGTAIGCHVHWVHSTNQAAAAVRWGFEYSWSDLGATFGNTNIIYGSTPVPADADLVQYKHYLTPFPDITPTADQDNISSVLIGRVFRNSSHADDTSTGTAGLLYIDIHYEIDTIGSRTELAK